MGARVIRRVHFVPYYLYLCHAKKLSRLESESWSRFMISRYVIFLFQILN